MQVLYLNLAKGDYVDVDALDLSQRHSMAYLRSLAERARVHYVLSNSTRFNAEQRGVSIRAIRLPRPMLMLSVIAYIYRNNIDAVVVHDTRNIFSAAFLRIVTCRRFFLQHHGEKTWLSRKSLLMKTCDNLISGYFFNGKDVAAPMIARGITKSPKIHEVSEGCSGFGYKPRESGGPKQLVFIGRLDHNKNAATLLRALVLLRRNDYLLRIYYSDDLLLPGLKQFCNANGLGARVQFMGAVPPDEIERALNTSDIFISCSLDESGGYSLIEALACGVFPVVSRIPAFNYLLQGLASCRQFDASDAAGLAAALRGVLDTQITEDVRKSIRQHYERRAAPVAVASQIMNAFRTAGVKG